MIPRLHSYGVVDGSGPWRFPIFKDGQKALDKTASKPLPRIWAFDLDGRQLSLKTF